MENIFYNTYRYLRKTWLSKIKFLQICPKSFQMYVRMDALLSINSIAIELLCDILNSKQQQAVTGQPSMMNC